MKLSEAAIKLLKGKNFAFLATLNKDGSPHVTPVWVDYSDGFIIINSTADRAKVKHVKRDPRVSIAVPDSQNPYKYIMIRGIVKEITDKGAAEHIDSLAFRYTGAKRYEGERKRVMIKIEPEYIFERL